MKKLHPEEVPPPGSVSQSALVAQEDRRREHWKVDGWRSGRWRAEGRVEPSRQPPRRGPTDGPTPPTRS